jgi:hypothetical protein
MVCSRTGTGRNHMLAAQAHQGDAEKDYKTTDDRTTDYGRPDLGIQH